MNSEASTEPQAERSQARRREPRKRPASSHAGTKTKSSGKVVDVRVVNGENRERIVLPRSSILAFETSQPFWTKIPKIGITFLKVCFLPVVALKFVLELVLTVFLVGFFGGGIAWAAGWVENEALVDFFVNSGDRGLELLRMIGLPF